MVQLINSPITTYHWKIGVNYLFVDVAEILTAVKNVTKTFKYLAIKLINDILQRYSLFSMRYVL